MSEADRDAATSARRNLLVWGTVAVVLGCSAAGGVGLYAPDFAELYRGFGPDLPLTARLVIGFWYVLFALPAAALLLTSLGLRAQSAAGARRALLWIHVLSATAVALGLLALGAMIAPLFTMGEPV
jgi:hypothetical protein